MIGERIKKLRKAAGESLSVTAAHCEIARSHLHGIENETNIPGADILTRIADHFNVPIDTLTSDIEREVIDISKIPNRTKPSIRKLIRDLREG